MIVRSTEIAKCVLCSKSITLSNFAQGEVVVVHGDVGDTFICCEHAADLAEGHSTTSGSHIARAIAQNHGGLATHCVNDSGQGTSALER